MILHFSSASFITCNGDCNHVFVTGAEAELVQIIKTLHMHEEQWDQLLLKIDTSLNALRETKEKNKGDVLDAG